MSYSPIYILQIRQTELSLNGKLFPIVLIIAFKIRKAFFLDPVNVFMTRVILRMHFNDRQCDIGTVIGDPLEISDKIIENKRETAAMYKKFFAELGIPFVTETFKVT